MKLLKNIGICTEYSYPYGYIEHKKYIPKRIYEEAKKNVIKSYARVYSINELKNCLYNNGPCLITLPVYNYSSEFWNGVGKHKGGHAVAIIGYNNEGFILRNSWGEKWGNKGYTTYKYEDFGSHWEIWTTVDDEKQFINNKNRNNKCCVIM